MKVWRTRSSDFQAAGRALTDHPDVREALLAIGEVKLLLGVARNSSDFTTKRNRLRSARDMLMDLLAKPLPAGATLRCAADVLAQVESELAALRCEPGEQLGPAAIGCVATSEESNARAMATWHTQQDIITGLRFMATLQPRIPLRVLRHHGKIHDDITVPPPAYARGMHEGIWMPILRTLREMGIDMDEPDPGWMASSIGPIPVDGGDFLPFLIAVREAVEADESIEWRVRALADAIALPRWCRFAHLVEREHGCLANQFFPFALNTIPGLTWKAREVLEGMEAFTAGAIAALPDHVLLGIKGIGPAKLRAIREWQATVPPDAVRLDCVER